MNRPKTRPIRLYYFKERDGRDNLGDALSPLIVSALSHRSVVHSEPAFADLIAIGSILEGIQRRRWQRLLLRPARPLTVWGSGTIRPGAQLSAAHLNCFAVRGISTARRLSLPKETPLGDPGLLVRNLYPARKAAGSRWVVIPHITDRDHTAVHSMRNDTRNCTVIDVAGDVISNLSAIQNADFVASTSLHGIVIANAYDKPFIWGKLNGRVAGERWKFDDYFSAFHLADIPRHDFSFVSNLHAFEERATTIDAQAVERVCENLLGAFAAMNIGS